MRTLLPPILSVARACLTLQEATAFFYEELDGGFVLTEIQEGADTPITASVALGEAAESVQDRQDMNVLKRALDADD